MPIVAWKLGWTATNSSIRLATDWTFPEAGRPHMDHPHFAPASPRAANCGAHQHPGCHAPCGCWQPLSPGHDIGHRFLAVNGRTLFLIARPVELCGAPWRRCRSHCLDSADHQGHSRQQAQSHSNQVARPHLCAARSHGAAVASWLAAATATHARAAGWHRSVARPVSC
jgi:hypothetical protein